MKRYIFLITTLLLSGALFSQQSNTMYFMQKNPQQHLLNPAFQDNCKFTLGGLPINATPVLGQVFLPFYFNFNITNFDYNTVIHKGEGIYSDSLVVDIPNLINNLSKNNYISFETHINILSAGYKFKKFYFTLGITEKMDFKFNFSRDLIQLPWYGNGHAANIGRDMEMTIGLNAVHYRELALGTSWQKTEKLTFGAKVKLLFGMMNIKTYGKGNQLNTDDVFFGFNARTDTKISGSIPGVNFHYNDTTGKVDSVTTEDFDSKYFLNFKNPGVALDLGAIYKFNDKITFSASLIDLGFIRWRDHTFNATDNGEFYYRGMDITPTLNPNDSTDVAQVLLDSLDNTFKITGSNKRYSSYLTPKLYLAGNYTLSEKLDVGGLFRMEYYPKLVHTSLTLSANYMPIRWFTLTGSYSFQNDKYYDVGLGFALKFGPYRMFLVNDNVTGMIWPQKTRNLNWRTGLYIGIGCNKKKKDVVKF
ncbi:MAG: hypothetical protein A2033_07550 [Bacteroidetes bacterium GWA2_31_9]|nr:MAG: hypothetical protein A2033_07550 [Bacteroidetes bacterium GWA2_31_9]